jgi:hypothetical protein
MEQSSRALRQGTAARLYIWPSPAPITAHECTSVASAKASLLQSTHFAQYTLYTPSSEQLGGLLHLAALPRRQGSEVCHVAAKNLTRKTGAEEEEQQVRGGSVCAQQCGRPLLAPQTHCRQPQPLQATTATAGNNSPCRQQQPLQATTATAGNTSHCRQHQPLQATPATAGNTSQCRRALRRAVRRRCNGVGISAATHRSQSYPSSHPSIHPSIYLSIHQSINLSIDLLSRSVYIYHPSLPS